EQAYPDHPFTQPPDIVPLPPLQHLSLSSLSLSLSTVTFIIPMTHEFDTSPCGASVCPDDQCSPSSATCQCLSVPALSAHPCYLPVPINATYQCPSELPPISASQGHLSVPYIGAAFQCLSVPPIRATS
ncbi:unnamed protein product, partial [Staurois parvus]